MKHLLRRGLDGWRGPRFSAQAGSSSSRRERRSSRHGPPPAPADPPANAGPLRRDAPQTSLQYSPAKRSERTLLLRDVFVTIGEILRRRSDKSASCDGDPVNRAGETEKPDFVTFLQCSRIFWQIDHPSTYLQMIPRIE